MAGTNGSFDLKQELGDILTVDITTRFAGRTLNEVKEARVRVDPKLALRDGVCNDFGKIMSGAKPGDSEKKSEPKEKKKEEKEPKK